MIKLVSRAEANSPHNLHDQLNLFELKLWKCDSAELSYDLFSNIVEAGRQKKTRNHRWKYEEKNEITDEKKRNYLPDVACSGLLLAATSRDHQNRAIRPWRHALSDDAPGTPHRCVAWQLKYDSHQGCGRIAKVYVYWIFKGVHWFPRGGWIHTTNPLI